MRRLLITFAALALLAACGPGEVGQPCQAEGMGLEEDCVDGAICTLERSETTEPPESPNGESYVCREICEIQADCPEGLECRRVVGSMLSSCQPDDDATTDPMTME
jgi:hypothetical protein